MEARAPAKTGFEKWQDGLSNAVGDVKWNAYDCEIQMAVNEFNQHLADTPNYMPLDWQLIKAMVWTETGGHASRVGNQTHADRGGRRSWLDVVSIRQ